MKKIFFFTLISCLIFSCQTNNTESVNELGKENVLQGKAQGTTYTIKYLGELKEGLKKQVDSLLTAFDQSLSTYIPNSLISKINQTDSLVIDENFRQVFLLSKRIL